MAWADLPKSKVTFDKIDIKGEPKFFFSYIDFKKLMETLEDENGKLIKLDAEIGFAVRNAKIGDSEYPSIVLINKKSRDNFDHELTFKKSNEEDYYRIIFGCPCILDTNGGEDKTSLADNLSPCPRA